MSVEADLSSPSHPSFGPPSSDIRPDAAATVTVLRKKHAHHSAEAVLTHPRYREARSLFVSGIMDLYDNDPFLNRLLIEAGRAVIFGLVMCLWADYDPRDRATWPTGTRLKAQLEQFGLASPRHVDSILARLVATDFVVLRTAEEDRRVRLIEPTERMFAHDLATLLPFYRALDRLFGEARYRDILDGDRQTHLAQRKASIAIFPWSARILSQNTDIMQFFTRPSAFHVLFKFIELDATGPEKPVREISFTELGERFGMSRSHVRNVLRDAEDAGLMERSGPRGVFHHVTPRCVASFDRFVAEALSSSDLSCVLAKAAGAAPAG
jgi:DNA-binding MarR family transcriptional regulator